MGIKGLVKSAARQFGYDIRPIDEAGYDHYRDIRQRIGPKALVFDIGANEGQTVTEMRRELDRPTIHAFEPGPETFAKLQSVHGKTPDVSLNNVALGAKPGTLLFNESDGSTMSSFLEPGPAFFPWRKIERQTSVPVTTVDDYCSEHRIKKIDVLKSDTQGFDLEVLKGAEGMLAKGGIQLVYMEIIFSEMYKNLPRFDAIYGFLADHGFSLVAFYKFHYQSGRVGWTDCLFERAK